MRIRVAFALPASLVTALALTSACGSDDRPAVLTECTGTSPCGGAAAGSGNGGGTADAGTDATGAGTGDDAGLGDAGFTDAVFDDGGIVADVGIPIGSDARIFGD